MTPQIFLPSGISVIQAKKDAKTLKKNQTDITHSQALNIICNKHGYAGTWNQFMGETKGQPIYPGSDDPHRNLLVIAINHLLEKDLISLFAPDDYYEKRLEPNFEREAGHTFMQIAERNTIIVWADIGYEELRVSVWWDYDHSKHPQADMRGNQKERFRGSSPLAMRSKYKRFVGVTCSGWLERRNGKYIQGRGKNLFEIYTRRENRIPLAEIPKAAPVGYRCEGHFYP